MVTRRLSTVLLAGAVVFLFAPSLAGAQTNCADCHSDRSFATQDSTGAERSLYVTETTLANSMHGGFACTDCHSTITDFPHAEKVPEVVCANCHTEQQAEYDLGVHKKADREDAPGCKDCHGTHDIRAASDTTSMVNPLHQAFTCARCHSNPRLVEKYQIPIRDPLKAYRNSVHGWLTLTEGKQAATCGSCHGSHRILPSSDPSSSIARVNTPKTCGQCHEAITSQYVESVHGKAVENGVTDAPDCNDCHSEHGIQRARAEGSPTSPRNLATQTCGRCHDSERLAGKYGLSADRVSSFQDTYHGLALRSGNLSVANCASCHGVHNILPSSDPKSMIAPANLQATCGRCHKDATANFASGSVHGTGKEQGDVVNGIVKNAYILLIVAVIGGMVVHNGLDFFRRSRSILRSR